MNQTVRTINSILILCFLCFFVAKASSSDDRAADAAAIRAHIESIFQTFIDGDEDKIFATHSEDWRGFLEGSRTPIKGIDDYMRANGIESVSYTHLTLPTSDLV